jgi:PIN domain nuclease of toxin-antitoxin system
MNLLLDTHIVLWWLADDPSLSQGIRDMLGDNANVVAVSSATVWEVAIKASIGKLEIDENWIDELSADGFKQLPISWPHTDRVRTLPAIHGDPFDRLLIAQAIEERFTLVTADSIIPTYPGNCIRDG